MAFPGRSRLRFSVRSLLAAMTLLTLFLGYHLNWIGQRREALASDRVHAFTGYPSLEIMVSVARDGPPTAPGLLFLFGEPPQTCLGLTCNTDSEWDQERKRIGDLFPEAKFHRFNGLR